MNQKGHPVIVCQSKPTPTPSSRTEKKCLCLSTGGPKIANNPSLQTGWTIFCFSSHLLLDLSVTFQLCFVGFAYNFHVKIICK